VNGTGASSADYSDDVVSTGTVSVWPYADVWHFSSKAASMCLFNNSYNCHPQGYLFPVKARKSI